jgi:hypothetical protein
MLFLLQRAYIIYSSMNVNEKLGRMWKGAIVAHFKALSSICLEGVGENHPKTVRKVGPQAEIQT